jgi:hypothetical protein
MSSYFRQDINDTKEWSEMDVRDMKNHVVHGASLDETAQFLFRSGTPFDVASGKERSERTWLVFRSVPSRPRTK